MNSASSPQDRILNVAMGGLLHDVGKLVQRGSGKRKNHMDVGADWLEERGGGWERYAFAARHHHTAPNASVRLEHLDDTDLLPLAAVIAHADNLSSSEREDVEGTMNWDRDIALRSIFDKVSIQEREEKRPPMFFPVAPLTDRHLYFPAEKGDSSILFNYEVLEENLKNHFEAASEQHMHPEWLLRVLEKYTAFVPSETLVAEDQERYPDISLFDHLRTTAMIAVCLQSCIEEQYHEILQSNAPYRAIEKTFRKNPPFLLVEGDIRGIQRYIYDVTSKGALRGLRARSFNLELLLEETSDRVLKDLGLPATQVLLSGGGHFQLLLPATPSTEAKLQKLRSSLSKDFWDLDPRLSLTLAWQPLSWDDLKTSDGLRNAFNALHKTLADEKTRPMADHLPFILGSDDDGSGKTCKICGARTRTLHDIQDEPDIACTACLDLYRLGGYLNRAKYLWRNGKDIETATAIADVPRSASRVWVLRGVREDIEKEDARFRPLPWAEYAYDDQLENVLNDGCIGVKKMGALRMDVDNLGHIFAYGLGESYTMSRVATLSRMFTFFFKSALPMLAARETASRVPERFPRKVKGFFDENEKRRIVLVYSGGDDLFAVGAWNEIVEFAIDVIKALEKFTGSSPHLSISGGMVVLDDKAPVAEGALAAARAERTAKEHETEGKGKIKDSLALFHAPGLTGSDNTMTFNTKTELPLVLEWLSAFQKGGRADKAALRFNPAYDRAFLRKILALHDMADTETDRAQKKSPLWKPLAAYSAARAPKDGGSRNMLIQLLGLDDHGFDAAYAAALWMDWLIRSQSDDETSRKGDDQQ